MQLSVFCIADRYLNEMHMHFVHVLECICILWRMFWESMGEMKNAYALWLLEVISSWKHILYFCMIHINAHMYGSSAIAFVSALSSSRCTTLPTPWTSNTDTPERGGNEAGAQDRGREDEAPCLAECFRHVVAHTDVRGLTKTSWCMISRHIPPQAGICVLYGWWWKCY